MDSQEAEAVRGQLVESREKAEMLKQELEGTNKALREAEMEAENLRSTVRDYHNVQQRASMVPWLESEVDVQCGLLKQSDEGEPVPNDKAAASEREKSGLDTEIERLGAKLLDECKLRQLADEKSQSVSAALDREKESRSSLAADVEHLEKQLTQDQKTHLMRLIKPCQVPGQGRRREGGRH